MKIETLLLTYTAGGKNYRLKIALDFSAKELLQNLPGGISLDIKTAELPGGNRYQVRLRSETPASFRKIALAASHRFVNEDRVFLNGYQSWSLSEEVPAYGRYPGLNPIFTPFIRMFRLKRYGDYFFKRYSARRGMFHSYSYSYIRRADGSAVLTGSLSEKAGYTIVSYRTRRDTVLLEKDCGGMALDGEKTVLDIVILDGGMDEVFDRYFDMMRPRREVPAPTTGWTSWYYYYEKIDEKIILDNLKAFADKKVPIDVFQIDDGYQKAVGDWLETNSKFPNGMKPIAKAAVKAGYKPGLWLAPFIAEEKSDLVRNNPNWLLRFPDGKPVTAGYNPFNWSGNFYALDIENTHVRDYLRHVFDTVLGDWGFGIVKLDFLYAPALLPKYGKPRGQIMAEGMEFLREAAGDKMILGCGMPLGPGFGNIEYCRIGSDVALSWEGEHYKILGIQTSLSLRHFRFRERVSVFNSLMSTIGRFQLNGRVWGNDPDVYILRTPYQWLSPDEKKTLYLLNQLFGGLVFTSDNIAEYSPDELRLYMSQFPFRTKEILSCELSHGILHAGFRIGGKSGDTGQALEYILVSNMGETPSAQTLNGVFAEGTNLTRNPGFTLAPHETRVFLKPAPDDYAVMGSSRHIFPGSEIVSIDTAGHGVRLEYDPRNRVDGEVLLRVPDGKTKVKVNGAEYPVELTEFGGVARVKG